jgi:hypothetical protein
MGHAIAELRALRSTNIGSERGSEQSEGSKENVQRFAGELSQRGRRQIARYVNDLEAVAAELRRVIRPGGAMIMVVGVATVEGQPIALPDLAVEVVRGQGFVPIDRVARPIANSRRYLPPPGSGASALSGRLKEEFVLRFNG